MNIDEFNLIVIDEDSTLVGELQKNSNDLLCSGPFNKIDALDYFNQYYNETHPMYVLKINKLFYIYN